MRSHLGIGLLLAVLLIATVAIPVSAAKGGNPGPDSNAWDNMKDGKGLNVAMMNSEVVAASELAPSEPPPPDDGWGII